MNFSKPVRIPRSENPDPFDKLRAGTQPHRRRPVSSPRRAKIARWGPQVCVDPGSGAPEEQMRTREGCRPTGGVRLDGLPPGKCHEPQVAQAEEPALSEVEGSAPPQVVRRRCRRGSAAERSTAGGGCRPDRPPCAAVRPSARRSRRRSKPAGSGAAGRRP
jgi:hypothetical protein